MASTKTRKMNCAHWEKLIKPMGMDSYLQGVCYTNSVGLLTGFAAYIQSGDAGRGHQVTVQTVSTVITAIGQKIALAIGENPTKLLGSEKLPPSLAQMLDGWRKATPPKEEKLPGHPGLPLPS
jgi:hypothetical protein